MDYTVWKLIHVISVVMFLGNITTGLFWKAHADRSGNSEIIAATFDGIIRSDRWFTIPGVIGIIVGGFAAAIDGHIPILRTGWIFWSLVLFSISGVIFSARIAPLQRQLAELMRGGELKSQSQWDEYKALSRSWEFWGLAALMAPIFALVLMVIKPSVPGL